MDFLNFFTLDLSVISIIFSIFTYFKSVIHDRKQATIDAFNRLQEQALDKLNLYKPSKIREIAEEPRSGEFLMFKFSTFVFNIF